jgi:hypothetical protein
MYSVYQHWDPLKVCVVGRAYPPEFFHWIKNFNTRKKFEKMAQETENDYQHLIRLLRDRFGVRILRPSLPEDLSSLWVNSKWVQPPTTPRDYFLMIHDRFWIPRVPNGSHAWSVFYRQNKHGDWCDFNHPDEFIAAMPEYALEISNKFESFKISDQAHLDAKLKFYQDIFNDIKAQGNEIVSTDLDFINGCFVSRIGKDLYFATQNYHDDKQKILKQVNELFPASRNHVVNAGGHGDAVYCPVTPGLIISLNDVVTYQDTFPNWEVVYLPPSDYAHMREFEHSMKRNKGRWFMPGFESDPYLQNIVEHYFDGWLGQVSETVFHVNILVVDQKNIIVSAHNDVVEKACQRYGVTVHVSPFRHKYFWDSGIHCITNDLDRNGQERDFFK